MRLGGETLTPLAGPLERTTRCRRVVPSDRPPREPLRSTYGSRSSAHPFISPSGTGTVGSSSPANPAGPRRWPTHAAKCAHHEQQKRAHPAHVSAEQKARDELRAERRRRPHGCWDHLIVAPLWVAYQANLGTLLRTCDAVGACMAVPRTTHYREALRKGNTLPVRACYSRLFVDSQVPRGHRFASVGRQAPPAQRLVAVPCVESFATHCLQGVSAAKACPLVRPGCGSRRCCGSGWSYSG